VTVSATNALGAGVDSAPVATATPANAASPNAVTDNISVGYRQRSVAVSPDGSTAYIANYDDNIVTVIDTNTRTVARTIGVGLGPCSVAVGPDGTTVYVANRIDNTVSVINTTTHAVTHTVGVGQRPLAVAVSPDGTAVYSVNSYDNTVSAINTTTHAVTHTIAVGTFPEAVAVSADGTSVYTANSHGNTVSVINTTTHAVTHTIAVGDTPSSVAVSPDGTAVYVANYYDNTVSVINTTTHAVTHSTAVGYRPSSVAVSPDGTTAYVASMSANTVSVVDVTTRTVTDTIAVRYGPSSVTVSPDGTTVYVANYHFSTASVITRVDPPDVPTGLSATPGDQHVMLTWTAPADDGGSPITDYTVEYRATGTTTWTTQSAGTTTSATVIGLTNGTSYDLKVSATNSKGTGTASATGTATPATVPDAPTGLTATPGDQQVMLTWTAPANDGGSPITGYTIEYRVTGETWVTYIGGASGGGAGVVTGLLRLGAGTTTTAGVNGLADATTYDFRVRALNSVGLSSTSNVATATTAAAIGKEDLAGTGFAAHGIVGLALVLIALGLTSIVAARRRSA
jgi:YVTN family beta-propeller protein